MTTQTATAAPLSRSLFNFSIFYGGMVCIAGVLGNKQVALGPLAVEAGIFAFLMLVITSSAVAELHGRSVANRLVVIGFVPLIASLLLTLLVLALPASDEMPAERQSAFEMMMLATPRIWVAGIIAYGISQFLNVTIFSRMKREGGRLLWLRSAVAGVLSQIVDTLLFITIAFYGVFPIADLLMGQMIAKVVLSALLVLIPYYGSIIGAVPPVLFALAESPTLALLTLVVYILVQQIEGNLIIPLVMANRVNLHPAPIAIGVLVIGQLFGFAGLFVAVPLLSALIILVDELWVRPLEAGAVPGQLPEPPEVRPRLRRLWRGVPVRRHARAAPPPPPPAEVGGPLDEPPVEAPTGSASSPAARP